MTIIVIAVVILSILFLRWYWCALKEYYGHALELEEDA